MPKQLRVGMISWAHVHAEFRAKALSEIAGATIVAIADENAARGYDLLLESGKVVVHLVHRWPDNAIKVVAKKGLTPNAWQHVLVRGHALLSGIEAALQSLLHRFSPEQFDQRLDGGALDRFLPANRKARQWELLLELYEDIAKEAQEDFWSVFERDVLSARIRGFRWGSAGRSGIHFSSGFR